MERRPFEIFYDSLREGRARSIDESVPPDFIDLKDEELAFLHPVEIQGEAYLADESDLVIQLEIQTIATLPCSICNEPVEVKMHDPKWTHVQNLSECRRGCYDFGDALRTHLILEAPHLAECQSGNCPQRKEIQQYLSSSDDENPEHKYFPFADLSVQEEKEQESNGSTS